MHAPRASKTMLALLAFCACALALPAFAAAAPQLLAISSPAPGMVHIDGTSLQASRVLAVTTTSGTLRLYRADGARAGDNPAGSSVTWSDTAIDVSDETILAGSRVTAVQTTSADSNRLVTSTWVAPTSLTVSALATDGQVRVAGHRLAQLPNLYVQTQSGAWSSFANPRTARSSAGVVSWTNDAIIVQSTALAGRQLQRIRLSENTQPTGAYIAEVQTSVTVAGFFHDLATDTLTVNYDGLSAVRLLSVTMRVPGFPYDISGVWVGANVWNPASSDCLAMAPYCNYGMNVTWGNGQVVVNNVDYGYPGSKVVQIDFYDANFNLLYTMGSMDPTPIPGT